MLPRRNKINHYLFFKLCLTLSVYISVFASQQELSLQIAGMKLQGQRKYQQDFFYVRPKEQAAEDGYCAGIFDGHGDNGDEIADTVEKLFLKKFEEHAFKGNIDEYLVFIFKHVNKTLKDLNIVGSEDKILPGENFLNKVNQSGTTAVIAYKLGTLLYIAHTGDSRAVWGKNINEQTIDHGTENKDELNRYKYDEYYYDYDKEINLTVTRLQKIGLNLTRALGDFDAEELTGWSAKPEINVIDLQKNPIIIMGSDGLWNSISTSWSNESFQLDNNTVAYDIAEFNFKINHNSANVVCKKLIREAMLSNYDDKTEGLEIMNQDLDDDKLIMQYEGRTLGDNTTVVVIHATPKENEEASNIKPLKIDDAGSISPNEKDKIENNKTVIEPENDKVKLVSDSNLNKTKKEETKEQDIKTVNIDKKTTKNKPTENLSNKRNITFIHIAVVLFLCSMIGYGYWHYHAQNI